MNKEELENELKRITASNDTEPSVKPMMVDWPEVMADLKTGITHIRKVAAGLYDQVAFWSLQTQKLFDRNDRSLLLLRSFYFFFRHVQ